MTTEDALAEADRFARSAAATYRAPKGSRKRAEAQAQISLAFSQLALAYLAEARS